MVQAGISQPGCMPQADFLSFFERFSTSGLPMSKNEIKRDYVVSPMFKKLVPAVLLRPGL